MGIIGMQENLRVTSLILQSGFLLKDASNSSLEDLNFKILDNKTDIFSASESLFGIDTFVGSYHTKVILINSAVHCKIVDNFTYLTFGNMMEEQSSFAFITERNPKSQGNYYESFRHLRDFPIFKQIEIRTRTSHVISQVQQKPRRTNSFEYMTATSFC